MGNPIYTEIINLIDSKSMKEHLFAIQENLRFGSYVGLISCAPISLDRKRELLVRLEKAAQDALAADEITQKEWDRAEIPEHIELLDNALNKLYSVSPGKSILIATNYTFHDGGTERSRYIRGDSFPVVSYSGVKLAIQQYNGDDELEPGEIPSWYWELELYHIQEDGTPRADRYTYVCSPDGEVQYFYFDFEEALIAEERFVDPWFGEHAANMHLPTPYQPGDILYIDCRPYAQPTYCVITKNKNPRSRDGKYFLSDTQCFFQTSEGKINVGDLQGGRYWEDWLFSGQQISPLYRAEIYEGELPPKYAFMGWLSRKVKEAPEFSRAVLIASSYFDISPKQWLMRKPNIGISVEIKEL